MYTGLTTVLANDHNTFQFRCLFKLFTSIALAAIEATILVHSGAD